MLQGKPSIAFIKAADALDKKTWSGTPYHTLKALQQYVGNTEYLGEYHPRFKILSGKIKKGLHRILSGKNYDYMHSVEISENYGKHYTQLLKKGKYDLIFACGASSEIAFLETDIPILYFSDSTFANMLDYNPNYTNLSKSSIRQGMEIEERAISKSSALLYPSDWAMQSAIRDFGAHPKKIFVHPLGANFEGIIPRIEKISEQAQQLELLFLAVEWEQKGGPIALECLKQLREKGIRARLTICGCSIPDDILKTEGIEYFPFLNKQVSAERNMLERILSRSDIMIVPTRTECFGIVFCEAGAYEMISISTDTGGVAGAITNGETGFLLPYNATGRDYAMIISEIWENKAVFSLMKANARKKYENQLNWISWAKFVKQLPLVENLI